MTLAYSDTSKLGPAAILLPAAFRERFAWLYQNDASSAADSQQARAASASRAQRSGPSAEESPKGVI